MLAALRAEFGSFFDPCPLNPTFDGLQIEWGNVNYVNPPFSQAKAWVAKGKAEWLKGKTVVFLLPISSDTEWFHSCLCSSAEIRYLRGRIKFIGYSVGNPTSLMLAVLKAGSPERECVCPRARGWD